jgi:putative membrane protein
VLSLLGAGAVAASAAEKSDPKAFVIDAIKGDNSELKLGELAKSKATRDDVRSFAETLIKDHAKAKSDAVDVANSLGVSPPTKAKKEAQKEYDKLNGLSGPAFDREFVTYMVKDHEKDVAKFEKAENSSDPAVAKLASGTLPDLRKHLETARTLEQQNAAAK